MNIVIFGLGALGTVYATFLKAAGHTVYAVTRKHHLKNLKQGKVRVSGIWGNREAILDGVFGDIGPLRRIEIDLIILAVKSYDTAGAVNQLRSLMKGNTLVLLSQNGYGNYEIVSEAFGADHVLLARVIFGSRLVETGYAEVTVVADDVRIGQPDNAVDEERIISVAETLNSAGIPALFDRDVYGLLWDKILYNCALNPLGAILECRYGDLASHDGSRRVMDQIITEIFSVALANGIKLRWESADAYCEHFYSRLVPPTQEHFPSMYYDLKKGKRVEIDALNGAIVRLARRKHVPVPVNETIMDMIKTKESLLSRQS